MGFNAPLRPQGVLALRQLMCASLCMCVCTCFVCRRCLSVRIDCCVSCEIFRSSPCAWVAALSEKRCAIACIFAYLGFSSLQTPADGASTGIYLATSKEVAALHSEYFDERYASSTIFGYVFVHHHSRRLSSLLCVFVETYRCGSSSEDFKLQSLCRHTDASADSVSDSKVVLSTRQIL